jgi:succinate dehydrogenase / fumarate reductase cytochrome b subunit
MSWFSDIYRTAVGKKVVMAVTGIILFGFVLLHMAGNLKLYAVRTSGMTNYPLNTYGEFLRTVGYPAVPHAGLLWAFRVVLLVAVVLHVWAAWSLTRMAHEARPARYAVPLKNHTSYASRTLRWGGVIILLFVVYHLLHLTWGTAHPSFQPGKPYENVVAGFQPRYWYVSLFYIAANLALGLHLYHGLWSLFQTMGWNHPRYNPWRRAFARAFAVIVTLGNVSIPLAVMTGLVR